jgi:hypothetical protein
MKHIFFIIFLLNCINVYTFTFEDRIKFKTRICNNLSSCERCITTKTEKLKKSHLNEDDFPLLSEEEMRQIKNELKEALSFNVYGYGIPFVGNREYFSGPCDCNKLMKTKTLCSELNKSDPLPGLSDLNLKGVLVSLKNQLKGDKNVVSTSLSDTSTKNAKNLRFKQKELKKPKSEIICNCATEEDRLRLFCQDKCKTYITFLNKIRSYYDDVKKNTEDWFDDQIKKFK